LKSFHSYQSRTYLKIRQTFNTHFKTNQEILDYKARSSLILPNLLIIESDPILRLVPFQSRILINQRLGKINSLASRSFSF